MSMGIHHAKGFWDMLIYKTYTRCLKSYTNFWTPCSTIRINHVIIPLRIPSQKLGLNVLIIPEHHAGPRTTRLLFIAWGGLRLRRSRSPPSPVVPFVGRMLPEFPSSSPHASRKCWNTALRCRGSHQNFEKCRRLAIQNQCHILQWWFKLFLQFKLFLWWIWKEKLSPKNVKS